MTLDFEMDAVTDETQDIFVFGRYLEYAESVIGGLFMENDA